MKTIVVAGATSAAAKTSLVVALLSALPTRAWGAMKITVTHDVAQGCPRGGHGCGVCASVGGGYRFVTDPEILKQPGTDTGRMTQAGADPVLWLITTPPFVHIGWRDVQRQVTSVDGLVIESNSLALCIKPDLTLFTINPRVPRSRWKASAPRLIEQSDLVIISLRDVKPQAAQPLIDEIHARRAGLGVVVTESVEQVIARPELSRRLAALFS